MDVTWGMSAGRGRGGGAWQEFEGVDIPWGLSARRGGGGGAWQEVEGVVEGLLLGGAAGNHANTIEISGSHTELAFLLFLLLLELATESSACHFL